MHAHSDADADAYRQIVHTCVARKFLDAYICTALYIIYIIYINEKPWLYGINFIYK